MGTEITETNPVPHNTAEPHRHPLSAATAGQPLVLPCPTRPSQDPSQTAAGYEGKNGVCCIVEKAGQDSTRTTLTHSLTDSLTQTLTRSRGHISTVHATCLAPGCKSCSWPVRRSQSSGTGTCPGTDTAASVSSICCSGFSRPPLDEALALPTAPSSGGPCCPSHGCSSQEWRRVLDTSHASKRSGPQ